MLLFIHNSRLTLAVCQDRIADCRVEVPEAEGLSDLIDVRKLRSIYILVDAFWE